MFRISMTKEEIKKIILELFLQNYGYDLSAKSEDFNLYSLSEIDSKIDSLEILSFIMTLEENFNITEVSIDNKIETLNDLVQHIYRYSNNAKF